MVFEGGHAVVLEDRPHVLRELTLGQQSVVQRDIVELEVHRGGAGLLAGRVGRHLHLRPAARRNGKTAAFEEILQEGGVPSLGVDDPGEGTDLTQRLEHSGVQRLSLILVL